MAAEEQKEKDFFAGLNEDQKKVVGDLKELHSKYAELECQFEAEHRALKLKYFKKFEPLYTSRADVLLNDGERLPDNGTTIPNFWLQAMKSHLMLADMIEANDEPALAYLEDVKAEYFGPDDSQESSKHSFSITFQFRENPFFEQTKLVKTYHMEMQPDERAPALVSTDATVIEWKPGKDMTKKVVTRRQKNKRTKQVRKLTETVSVPSFFNFFTKHEIPSEAELNEMNEDQVEELEVMMEADFEAGSILKDKVIPKAVLWFTGEAHDSELEDNLDGADDEDFDEEDGEVDAEEDEEDEEEEEDDGAKKSKKKKKKKKDDQNCRQS